MSQLTKGIDNLYPDDSYWYDNEFEYFVSDLKTRGINIVEEIRGKRKDGMNITAPAISFSGFCSQGDGLAFDCNISWPEFFRANPSFVEALPVWFLLLVSNPYYFNAGTRRLSRGNTMSAFVEDDYPDVVDHGYFAGTEIESLPDLDALVLALEKYVLDVCESEADKMYKALEAAYEAECEYMREQALESIKETEAERLREVLLLLPAAGQRGDFVRALDEADICDVDFEDLEVLGLVRHDAEGIYIKEIAKCR